MKNIHLEIITPERVVMEADVDSLILPAFEGRMGVLPGHIKMVVQIIPGELAYNIKGRKDYFALGAGFAEITPRMVRIFVEEASLADEINIEKARQEALEAQQKIKFVKDLGELKRAEVALKVAMAKLKIAQTRRPKR